MAITLRANKGSALTFEELDANFTTLDNRTSDINSLVSESVGESTETFAGDGIKLQVSDTTSQASASIKLSKFIDTSGVASATATEYDVLTNADLIATTASAGTTGIAYDSSTKTITYTPPDLTSFLTSSSSIDLSSQTLTGTLPSARLPNISLTSVTTVASEAAQLALTTEEGDVVIRSDENKSYIRNSGTADPHDMTNFSLLTTPDTDTTYSISIEQTNSTDTDPTLNLTPNQGTADTITIKGGTGASVSRSDSGESVTISATTYDLSLEKTEGPTITATAISSDVVTSTAHGLNDGDSVRIIISGGNSSLVAGDYTAQVDTDEDEFILNGAGTADDMSAVTLKLLDNTDPLIRLDPSTGSNDEFVIEGGTNISATRSGSGDKLTISGVAFGTTTGTALEGNTTFAFADITSKPTTISGYGITDALAIGTTATTAMAGNTTFAFADITSKPTTISGYGITDALQLGTSSTTALAGDTVVDNLLLEIPKSGGSVNIGDKTFLKVAEVTIDARYQYYSAQLAVVGTGAAEGVANEKILAIRVKQQAAMGDAPLVDIDIYNNGNEDYDFGHVVAVNSGTETRVDIYFRPDGPNSGAEVYKMADTATATVAWSSTGNSYATSAPANFVQGGAHQQWHSGNQAGIFGTTNGILKADGSGALSAAVAGTDYSTLAIGTTATTAMAGNTTFAFSDITSKPTTISGYGITDALAIGTTATTAMAGNTTFAFSDITSKPTTISGYGITDALAIGTTATTAMAGNTTFAFADITSKPTTISGYGITDALAIGTSSTTAMAGNTALSAIGGSLDLSSQVTGTLPVGNMAATALTTVQTAASQAAQLALTTQEGDVVVRTDENKTYMRNSGTADPHDMTNFTLLATPTDAVTSVDGNTGAVTTLQIGTSATTAMAGNTTFAFSDITSKPTTISGYGITDALAIGTSSTTAMAGDTTFAFADITSKPTTISGYGITDALAIGTSSTTAMAGDTTFAFADITSKPTTISGYGITDALAIGTSSTTAMAGDTTFAFADITSKPTTISGYGITDAFDGAFASLSSKPTTISGYGITDALALGTSSTTALAGDTTFDRITEGDTSIVINDTGNPPSADNNIVVTVAGGQKAKFDYNGTEISSSSASDTLTLGSTTGTGAITLGRSTAAQTINIAGGSTVGGTTNTVNIASTGSTGSTQTVNIARMSATGVTTNVLMGNTSSSATSNITLTGNTTITNSGSSNTITIGGTTQSGAITLGRSTQTQTINIGTGYVASSKTKTINIGTGNNSGSTTNINIGPSNESATRAIDINGNLTVDGTTQFDHMVTFKSDASTSNVYDQIVSFQAKGTSTTWYEAARIATLGSGSAPSRMIIGQDNAAMTFFDGFGSRYIYPAHADTGVGTNGVCDLGSYSARWKLGRFSSGTTTSSDRNEKRDIEELTAAELRVAVRCKPLLRKYRRIDAYEEKGEAARIHFGIIAQDLDDAFTAEGLDAHRYAMFMEDTWYEYEGGVVSYPTLEDIPEEHRANATEHTAMGVRYEQLLAFMIAAL